MGEVNKMRVRRMVEQLNYDFALLPILCLMLLIVFAVSASAQNLDPALAKTLPSIRANSPA